LCRDYATLNASRVALDLRIQIGASRQDGTEAPLTEAEPGAHLSEPDGDGDAALWAELDEVLDRQSKMIADLIETSAADADELRLKADVLGQLLRSDITAPEQTRALTQSLVRDIAQLFPAKISR
jgi:hypothetical protein